MGRINLWAEARLAAVVLLVEVILWIVPIQTPTGFCLVKHIHAWASDDSDE